MLRRLPRGRYRLLSIAPSHGRFIAQLAGDAGAARFVCDLADLLAKEVCLTGLYEPPVTRVFQRHLSRGGVVVDVGSNWGYFSLVAAAAVGAPGCVLALEPDPRQFAALSGNVELNGFTQVTPVCVAASSSSGQTTLAGYAETDANRGVSRLANAASSGPVFTVPCTTVDALTSAYACVDLIKIDVEGAEDAVLEGMRDGLSAGRYRVIVLELHPDLLRARGVDPDGCVRRLAAAGYDGWTIDGSPAMYRRAADPAIALDALLRPLERWPDTPWPHLLWRKHGHPAPAC